MKVEIFRMNGDLKREVWVFELYVSFSANPCIYFDEYSFQARTTKRCKWIKQARWSRLNTRNSNIGRPTILIDIKKEVIERYKLVIETLPIF